MGINRFRMMARRGGSRPVMTSSDVWSAPENAAFDITLMADRAVTWELLAGLDASQYSLAGSTLTLAAQDYETPIDDDANNTYRAQVRLTSTDTGLSTTQVITTTVADVAESPVATPILQNHTARRGAAGRKLAGDVLLSQFMLAGGDAPDTWTLTGLPANWTYEAATGRFWPTIDNPPAGSHSVTVTATNAGGTSASKTLTLNIVAGVATVSKRADIRGAGAPAPLSLWGGAGSPNLRGVRIEVARGILAGTALTFMDFYDPAVSGQWMTIGNEDDAYPSVPTLYTVRNFEKIILDKLTAYNVHLVTSLSSVAPAFNIFRDAGKPNSDLIIDGVRVSVDVSDANTNTATVRKWIGGITVSAVGLEVKNCDLSGFDVLKISKSSDVHIHHNFFRRFSNNHIFDSIEAGWVVEENIFAGCTDNASAGAHHDNVQHGASAYPKLTSDNGVVRKNFVIPGNGNIMKGQGIFFNDISYNQGGATSAFPGAGEPLGPPGPDRQYTTGSSVHDITINSNLVLTGVTNGWVIGEVGTGWIGKYNAVLLPPASMRPAGYAYAYPTIRIGQQTGYTNGLPYGVSIDCQYNVSHGITTNTIDGSTFDNNTPIGNIEAPWSDYVANPGLSLDWDTVSFATAYAALKAAFAAKPGSLVIDCWPLDIAGEWRELA